jgi:hypothetical protein
MIRLHETGSGNASDHASVKVILFKKNLCFGMESKEDILGLLTPCTVGGIAAPQPPAPR